MIDIDDIEAARARIAPHVRRTPVTPATQLQAPLPVDTEVLLKLELLQVTGSFKARGAMNRFLGAPPEERPDRLVTASGGNHGLAVARTASVAGVPATIFVPGTVSPAKVTKMEKWGAEVRIVGEEWSESQRGALAYAEETGATYFHPFADSLVMAGQGTLGLEMAEDLPDMDAILIAIGGGGLIAGVGTALRSALPGVRIIGVEPEGAPTLKASLDADRVVELDAVTTGVATMACKRTEDAVFRTVRGVADEIVLISDEEMAEASRWLWFEMGIAADLSGAASIAALRRYPDRLAGYKRICALVCGAGAEGTGG